MRLFFRLLIATWVVIAIAVILYAINGGFMQFGEATDDQPSTAHQSMALSLTSPAFENGGAIPSIYTCEGEGEHPPLEIIGVPEDAKSLAFTMVDIDVPAAIKPSGTFVHWLLYHIPPEPQVIGNGAPAVASGSNDAGGEGYTPPCPPRGYEPAQHRYVFTLYALDNDPMLDPGASLEELKTAMSGHIIGEATLIGIYGH